MTPLSYDRVRTQRFLARLQLGLQSWRWSNMKRHFLPAVCWLLVVSLTNLTLLPFSRALTLSNDSATAPAPNPAESYAHALSALNTQIDEAVSRGAGGLSRAEQARALTAFEVERTHLEADWHALRQRWEGTDVSAEVRERQQALEKAFAQNHAALRQHLQQADTAAGQRALHAFLQTVIAPPSQNPIDLNNLPWRVEHNRARAPAEDPEALERVLEPLTESQARDPQHQALGPVIRSSVPTPADLAPTLDAPQTAAIRQQATVLGNDPHKIYQWVHDQIYFFPSYGSVQGAQDTLDKKSGNAFDTASLLIALLRSANIPARYVYGTVDIPARQVMNWVGGAENAEAAQQILGQGGIPNVALTRGGQIEGFRLEQVWVEAYLDYFPARAGQAGGRLGGEKSWVPMDGSFKQYTFTAGMDLQTAVPFDAQGFLDQAQQGATVNEAEGWVQNLNQAHLQAALTTYQQRLKTYLDAQKGGQATVGDVLGVQNTQIDPLPYLAGTLPYSIKATASRFSEIPSHLRHQFRYRLFQDAYSRRIEATPLLEFQAPTVTLAGKKLTLAWVAASEADQKAIEALLPKPHADGSPIQPSELPTTLPASLQLKPQLRLEGEIKAEGYGMRTGSEPIGAGAFTTYANLNEWDETADQLIVGQQSALGLSIQGISAAQLNTLKTRMEATKATLQEAQSAPQDQRLTILKGMTGEHLTGDLLTATIWGYFANNLFLARTAQTQAKMIEQPGLSYGLFHLAVKPNKLYGTLTTGITFQGLNIDVGHMRYIRWSKVNDKTAWIAYNRMRGQQASALEHATPEAFWIDRTKCRYTDENGNIQNPSLTDCPQAVSAVKAIAIAARQGQKIYTITQKNAALALPKLSLSQGVAQEIQNAVAAGKEVTVHEKAINAYGFSGFGYTIIDPETGVGAYLIEGKGNGGSLATKIGLGIGYVLLTIGLTILIFTVLYALTLYLVDVFGLALIYTGKIMVAISLGLLSPSNTIFLKEYPCIQAIISNLNAGFAAATFGATAATTKLLYIISALGFGGTLGGLSYGGGIAPCF